MDLQRAQLPGEARDTEGQKRGASGRLRRKALPLLFSALLAIVAWRDLRPLLGFGKGAARPAVSPGMAKRGDELAARGRSGGESRDPRPGDRLAVLRLAELDRLPIDSRATRNPWQFVEPPLPPLRSRGGPLNPSFALSSTIQPSQRVAEPPPAPHPAEFTLLYLGSFGTPETKIAVFTDGKRQLNLLEGGVIDGQFRIARVDREFVDIQFVDFPDWPAKRFGLRRP
jgi:hypothetical protein